MAVGITIGQFVTPNIEAQGNGVFDKITCRELEVVDENGKKAIVLESKDYTRRLTFFDYTHGKEAIILESTGGGGGAKPINLLRMKHRTRLGETLLTGHDISTSDLQIRDWEGYPTVRIQAESSIGRRGITIYHPATFDSAIELMSDPNYENLQRSFRCVIEQCSDSPD